ncbi:MAG: VOC family protein [Candidatus Thermoplasmatota archaeon]|nr:VOC family protein [Candidatus Thermoplasmatota archaeon]
MNINHLHLTAVDVAASTNFFETYFGFRKKADHGDGVLIVNDEGFLVAIDPIKEEHLFPNWLHYGFCLDDGDQVKRAHELMQARNVPIAKELIEFGGEAVGFRCLVPNGCQVEVSWHAE